MAKCQGIKQGGQLKPRQRNEAISGSYSLRPYTALEDLLQDSVGSGITQRVMALPPSVELRDNTACMAMPPSVDPGRRCSSSRE